MDSTVCSTTKTTTDNTQHYTTTTYTREIKLLIIYTCWHALTPHSIKITPRSLCTQLLNIIHHSPITMHTTLEHHPSLPDHYAHNSWTSSITPRSLCTQLLNIIHHSLITMHTTPEHHSSTFELIQSHIFHKHSHLKIRHQHNCGHSTSLNTLFKSGSTTWLRPPQ